MAYETPNFNHSGRPDSGRHINAQGFRNVYAVDFGRYGTADSPRVALSSVPFLSNLSVQAIWPGLNARTTGPASDRSSERPANSLELPLGVGEARGE